jgi:hypothetical protein
VQKSFIFGGTDESNKFMNVSEMETERDNGRKLLIVQIIAC